MRKIGGAEKGLICDKGMFYGGTSGLNISAKTQRGLTTSIVGGEGMFQTRLEGSGVAILYSPVPAEEIEKVDLNGQRLQVDGNFALMRSLDVEFSVEKSSKSWMSTAVSGEGLLQTFRGQGSVWIAPTQGIYERLSTPAGLGLLGIPPGSMGTTVKTGK